MLSIGLTGNIGSGKSTVAKVFAAFGVPVFYADYQAKQCYFEPHVCDKIIDAFGPEFYINERTINRKYIASCVFSNPLQLTLLNSIIHPALNDRFKRWKSQMELSGNQYVVLEAAILFEANLQHMVDRTVCVYASRKQRTERVLQRDDISRSQLEARMNNQWPAEKIVQSSDYCIHNKDKKMILAEILSLHERFLHDSRQFIDDKH